MSVFRNKSEILLLEPCDGKLSRTVLRGESARKGADLPAPVGITVGGYAAEVILKCANYSELSIYGLKNEDGEYIDSECRFSAKVIASGTVRISFDYMKDVDFAEKTCRLQIDGTNGKETHTTMVTITRKSLN